MTVFAVLYGLVLAVLFLFGANGYLLIWMRRRFQPPPAAAPTSWPAVTVQIPVFNERDVVERVIAAAGRLRYDGPLDIQVLDDSTDDSAGRAAAAVAELVAAGRSAVHIIRTERTGYKAGALAAGLALARGELLLVLDADFLPPPDLVTALVCRLRQGVGCVQARWGHLNRDRGPVTRGQALGIDLHFFVEKRARAAAGWPLAFNGSAGLWRRRAIEDAGGWSADTLTEDLDLSYRAWLSGWNTVYADDVECPGEIPEGIAAFKAQQRRWARGSTQTARKLLPTIWRSPASLATKLQATLHLTHYFVHPLILAAAALALPLGFMSPSTSRLWTLLAPFAMATGGPLAMALCAGREAALPPRRRLADALAMTLLGVGLSISNATAVLGALSPRPGTFHRTPKGGSASSYRLAVDRFGAAEIASAAACVALAGWLALRGLVAMVPFLVLCATGLGVVGALTLEAAPSAESHRP